MNSIYDLSAHGFSLKRTYKKQNNRLKHLGILYVSYNFNFTYLFLLKFKLFYKIKSTFCLCFYLNLDNSSFKIVTVIIFCSFYVN